MGIFKIIGVGILFGGEGGEGSDNGESIAYDDGVGGEFQLKDLVHDVILPFDGVVDDLFPLDIIVLPLFNHIPVMEAPLYVDQAEIFAVLFLFSAL